MKRLLVTLLCSYTFAYNFYVSPEGSDSNSGTKDKPVATIGRSVERAKKLIEVRGYPKEGIVIYIDDGIYRIDRSIVIDSSLSGNQDAPFTIKAKTAGNARLIGGREFDFSDFSPVTDEMIIERLHNDAKGKVFELDLKKHGLKEYGELPLYGHSMTFLGQVANYNSGRMMPELFYNGNSMTLARWPNNEYAKIKDIVENGSVPRAWMEDLKGNAEGFSLGIKYIPAEQRDNPPKGFAFTIEGDRSLRWTQAKEAWMYGFWYWNWSDQSVEVASVDSQTGVVKSVQPSAYGLRKGQRFYIYNLLEELDTPGEWYLDRQTGLLYFYPPDGYKDGKVAVSVLDSPMFLLNGASNVHIDGLSLECSRDIAIQINNGQSNLIKNCSIKNIASAAVSIYGGTNNGVAGCHIYNTGAGGIRLSGGDRKTLTPAGHYAENNNIHNFSRIVQTYSPAINLLGVGNRAAHNKIHDAPHTGLMFSGNDHIIEYNEIYDVMKNATDMGAICIGRSHTMWGNKITNNYIHHIETQIEGGANVNHPRWVHCIYLDDTIAGIEVTGNIFYKVKEALAASGSDIVFANNIVIDSKSAVWWKSITPTQKEYGDYKSEQERIERMKWNPSIEADIQEMPYNSDLWRNRYPNLKKSIENTYGPQRCVIKNNVLVNTPSDEGVNMSTLYNTILVDNMYLNEAVINTGIVADNLVINPSSLFYDWIRKDWPKVYSEKHYNNSMSKGMIIYEDPGFYDYEGRNFTLKEDSPVFRLIDGFEPIPFEKIGLLKD